MEGEARWRQRRRGRKSRELKGTCLIPRLPSLPLSFCVFALSHLLHLTTGYSLTHPLNSSFIANAKTDVRNNAQGSEQVEYVRGNVPSLSTIIGAVSAFSRSEHTIVHRLQFISFLRGVLEHLLEPVHLAVMRGFRFLDFGAQSAQIGINLVLPRKLDLTLRSSTKCEHMHKCEHS
eukprot:6072335-Pleurochrysis_carterae.AAC.2